MAAINFPDSPVNGDTHVVGNVTYVYDNAKAKWNGAGQTLNDRLTEGSNSLEITAGNDLIWTGDRVGLNTSSPEAKLEVRDSNSQGVIIRSDNTQSTNTNKALRIRNNSADNTFWVSHKGFTQITINDDTDYSTNTTNTSNTANTVLALSNQNGSDGTGVNNYVGINFSVANGATSTAQLQYVRTGDNSGKFEFKARNTSSSYPNIMTLLSDGSVGIKTEPTTNAALDVMQGYYSIMYGATNGVNGTRPDNTNKEGRVVQYHRDNEEEPLGAIVTFSQSNAGKVYIGGGSSLVNAATETALYAASNYTTTGGTKMLSVTTSGVTANELFTVTHPDASSADTALFQNTTSGGDNRVRITCFANGGGDPYIKFDAGGSNFVVGEEYNGTTSNKLCLGTGENPSNVTGITINGLGQTVIGSYTQNSEQLRIQGGEADIWLDSSGSGIWRVMGSSGGSTHLFRVYDNTNSGDRLTINASGRVRLPAVPGVAGSNLANLQIESDGNLCTTTSIRAAKTNISPLADTSWLFDLNPVTFNWRTKTENEDGTLNWGEEADGGTQYGLIAEEVEEVKDDFCYYNNDGELSGVHYDRLVAPLLKVVQQQKEEIEALKTRLDAAGL